MAKMIELDWHPNRETLRRFGWIAVVGFSFLALIAWQEWLLFAFGLGVARTAVTAFFAGLAILAGFFSLVAPGANRPIYLGLAIVTFPIGFVLSYILMGLLFYGLITPVGLLCRLLGRDTMKRHFDADAATYWSDCRPGRSKESYFKQF